MIGGSGILIIRKLQMQEFNFFRNSFQINYDFQSIPNIILMLQNEVLIKVPTMEEIKIVATINNPEGHLALMDFFIC